MKTINLYSFTRVELDTVTDFEKVLSNRLEGKRIKEYEFQALISLVNQVVNYGIELEKLSGFYYSYTIEHIGKEFDLLKVCTGSKVLNIELKSEMIDIEKIERQLQKNQYYLNHLAPKLYLFTYIEKTGEIFEFKDNELIESDFKRLISIINSFDSFKERDIEKLFRAKDFLISPLNTPERFLKEGYFLTPQQDEIKRKILKEIQNSESSHVYGIKGRAGTGKTLLLYDLAKECGKLGKCCVIHCGMLCEGHEYLKQSLENVQILSIKQLDGEYVLTNFDFIFVDETQRIKITQFCLIRRIILAYNKVVIFSFDDVQTLSKREENNRIPDKLSVIPNYIQYELTDRIRTNKEIVSFIRNMINLKDQSRIPFLYENIDVLYSGNNQEAHRIIELYTSVYQYEFISYTQSRYYGNSIDDFGSDMNTHQVIGQEFDNVLIIMDNNFLYDSDGVLRAKEHPNPNYLFWKLFLQAVTRAREKLCILVVGNYELFKDVLSIKTGKIKLNTTNGEIYNEKETKENR